MHVRILKVTLFAAVCLTLGSCVTASRQQSDSAPSAQSSPVKKFVKDGVAVELSMSPISAAAKDVVEVRFRVTDAASGEPMTGLYPIAWMDRTAPDATQASSCQDKIRSFLSGSLQARPEVDLNTYYIVALNRGGTVSVIDPLLSFGGMKLLTLVMLGGEGADWVVTPDQQTLFVTLPLLNEVVAIDASTWKVASRIAVGENPQRIGLQPDGAYLWVGYSGVGGEGSGGVSVIGTDERREIARIPAGRGDHEIAFTHDSRYAFVSNRIDGSLSVMDVRALREVKRIPTGSSPVALGYSALSNAVYVGHEDGAVVVIDGARHEVRSHITTSRGLASIGFSPDGRWGFVVNTPDDRVHVIDSSTDQIAQTIAVGKSPDKVSFTDLFAYVRATAAEEVTMIRLSTVAPGQEPDLTRFTGGQVAPEYASGPSLPPAIVPAPEGNAVLVSNPADRVIYYYMEGMAAPMGSFQNYRREPLGVLAVNRKLREREPGVYSTTSKLKRGGHFDVPFLLDAPRLSNCFAYSLDLPVEAAEKTKTGARVERLFEQSAAAGSPLRLRLRLTDSKSGRSLDEVKDLRVLTFTPGTFQKREWAQAVGDGIYEATIVPPRGGVYYVFIESQSLGHSYRDFPHWVVQVTESATAAPPHTQGGQS